MIYINVIFKSKNGQFIQETKTFDDCIKALRFMYGIRRKGHIIDGYKCDDPEESEYLNERFRI